MTQSYLTRTGARRLAATLTLVVSAGATAAAAGAQTVEGQWTVTARSGLIDFSRNTSLESAPFVGLDADYGLKRYVTIGTSLIVSRPQTRKEDFLTSLTYGIGTAGDTTFFYNIGQTLSMVEGEVAASLRYPIGRVVPFLTGGVGYYGLFLDPQINNGVKRRDGLSFSGGGGIAFRISERAGIQLDARNLTLTDYSAAALDPSGGRNPNILFPEDFPQRPAAKKSVSNFIFAIGFRYVPGGDIAADPRDPNAPREDQR